MNETVSPHPAPDLNPRIRDQLVRICANLVEAQEEHTRATNDSLSALNAKVSALQNSVDQLLQSAQAARTMRSRLREAVDLLTARVDECGSRLITSIEQLSDFDRRLSTAQEQIQVLESAMTNLPAEVVRLLEPLRRSVASLQNDSAGTQLKELAGRVKAIEVLAAELRVLDDSA